MLGEDAIDRFRELRAESGKDIWLFGGGALFGSLPAAGLVDAVEVSVMPVILGAGVPLMSGHSNRVKLTLVSSDRAAGATSLKYSVGDHRG